jgi:hypothetical protein
MVYTCAWPRLRANGIQPPGLPSATASTARALAAPSRRCPCRRPSGAGGAGAGAVTGRGGGGEMAACRPQGAERARSRMRPCGWASPLRLHRCLRQQRSRPLHPNHLLLGRRALPMPLQAPKPLALQMSARAGGQHRLPWINRSLSLLLCWNLWGMNPRAND